MSVRSLAEAAKIALQTYGTYDATPTKLVPLGLRCVDDRIGGLGPGSIVVVGAMPAVGKTSLALACAMAVEAQGARHGIVSLEDGEDVFGSRALGSLSGVDTLKLRTRKGLTEQDLAALRLAEERLKSSTTLVGYAIGAKTPQVKKVMTELAKAGCSLIWLDHFQVYGANPEVLNPILQEIHEHATSLGVALVILSQFTERKDPRTGRAFSKPSMDWLRGTSDLAIKARLVLLMWMEDGAIQGEIAKSNYGGAGLQWRMFRDASGTLRESLVPDFS